MPVNISTDPISDRGAFRLTMERLKMVPHDVIRGLSRTISLLRPHPVCIMYVFAFQQVIQRR